MRPDPAKTGAYIYFLRKLRRLTQAQLGDALHVSFQAVSKWERGETLPDVSLLPDLAQALETTVDSLLAGGETPTEKKPPEAFARAVTMAQIKEGVECIERIGELLGKDNFFYMGAVGGINLKMNMEFEKHMADPYTRECLFAEAATQAIENGAYIALEDISTAFKYPKWAELVSSYARRYGIEYS